ncbi:FtsX-like permease family protein [Catellatospora vulcania]|uniref:FtsX-like permease family protein n=1 Tax=Catellatospora vulcania TaxID=1460450 RepID=UPI0012D38127|nr:FtsX-like permease family protein [Catellatospora vulcania]
MFRIILAQLRRRAARSVALLTGVLVATTGFTVLTGTVDTARLQVTQQVSENYRGAYDILVRPKDSRLELEDTAGLIRPSFLSDHFGGISLDQVAAIRGVRGVEVAAPIAMIGISFAPASVDLDLSAVLPRDSRSVYRFTRTRITDGGTTRITTPPWYHYFTPNELAISDDPARQQDPFMEIVDGREVPICTGGEFDFDALSELTGTAVQLGCGSQTRQYGRDVDHPGITSSVWGLPFLLAAIDPAAEAALVGLDRAVDSGEYLTGPTTTLPVDDEGADLVTGVPVLYSSQPSVDATDQVVVERLPAELAAAVPGADVSELAPRLSAARGTVVWTGTVSAAQAHQELATSLRNVYLGKVGAYFTPQPVRYTRDAAGRLTPVAVPDPQSQEWGVTDHPQLPPEVLDTAFRGLTRQRRMDPESVRKPLVQLRTIGTFDPRALQDFSMLAGVPLTTYRPARLACGDSASCAALGGRDLLPSLAPGGYQQQPPLMLTTIDALPKFYSAQYRQADAGRTPVSAVRVRVAGVTGFDDLSREIVRRTAEEIATSTGLDVDIMLGSSPTPQQIALPAGRFGRPALVLEEGWSRKGVAAAIVKAVDRKSLVLFGLILVVCVLFLANATAAGVRSRQRELAILACTGWPRGRLAGLIAGEVALLGLVGGVLAGLLAVPLAGALGVTLSPVHAASAVPVALVVALLAALPPAWRASRARPGTVLHAPARPHRGRPARRRTVFSLAMANLFRVPGRTLIGIVALALGVAGLTLVAAVTWAFHGSVTGTLLGDAVSVRARGVDQVAVAAVLLLGLAAVADVLFVNVRDRSAELAALRAMGWSAGAMARLVAYEGLGIGLMGAALGAAAGLAGTAWFAGSTPPALVGTALFAAGAGVLSTGLAAVAPALAQQRIPMRRLLAEE